MGFKKGHKLNIGNKFASGTGPKKTSWKKGHIPWNKNKKYDKEFVLEHGIGLNPNSRNGFKIGHKGYNRSEWENRKCPECNNIFNVSINSKKKHCSISCNRISRRTTVEHICPWCKNKFVGYKDRKYCGNVCKGKMQDNIQSGITLKNKYKTGELVIWNKKERIERNCFYCNKIMKVIKESKTKFCDEKCMGLNNKGRRPGNYIDGRSKFLSPGRYGDDWDKIRYVVYLRDYFTCQDCGVIGKSLDIHHKIPFLESKDNSLSNLISLCRKCHMKAENKIRKQKIILTIGGGYRGKIS